MRVTNPRVAPLLMRVQEVRQATHFYARLKVRQATHFYARSKVRQATHFYSCLNKLSYGTAWTSYGTTRSLVLVPHQGFELRTSTCTFLKIQQFCHCRYLKVPTMAKPLYLHKSTSQAHQLCYWYLMSPKLGN
jgi:hypothetical protein